MSATPPTLQEIENIKEIAVAAQLKLRQAVETVKMVSIPLEIALKTLDEAFKLSLQVQMDLLDHINRMMEESSSVLIHK
tara:strand:- start:22 stop:258 length:237 start_codon:yes stop_codon:yes gene_type:complete